MTLKVSFTFENPNSLSSSYALKHILDGKPQISCKSPIPNTIDAIQNSHDKELLAYPVHNASFWTWVIYTPIAQHNCALN
jgi:hypothetical protein